MSDMNLVVIDGIISSKFYVQPAQPGKEVQAVNFTINNESSGKDFRYAVVAWRTDPEKILSVYKEGDVIRIIGHLQSTQVPLADGKTAYLAKVCADKIDLLS